MANRLVQNTLAARSLHKPTYYLIPVAHLVDKAFKVKLTSCNHIRKHPVVNVACKLCTVLHCWSRQCWHMLCNFLLPVFIVFSYHNSQLMLTLLCTMPFEPRMLNSLLNIRSCLSRSWEILRNEWIKGKGSRNFWRKKLFHFVEIPWCRQCGALFLPLTDGSSSIRFVV